MKIQSEIQWNNKSHEYEKENNSLRLELDKFGERLQITQREYSQLQEEYEEYKSHKNNQTNENINLRKEI